VSATDPDGNSLTYSASNLPTSATFTPATRTFAWTPTSAQVGIYNVIFTVSDGSLKDSKTVKITITSSADTSTPPIAQFTANTTGGGVPLAVQFTDKSVITGTATYKWEFKNEKGKITSTSTVKNPSITYATTGNKTVKLTVTDASGSDSEIKTSYIIVSSITVTSPNGGETLKRGTTQTVTWSYTGSPGSTVKLVLMKGSTEVGTIAGSVSTGSNGKGSYSWPLSLSGSGGTGSDYKVSVQSIAQPTIRDTSNSYFTITPGTAQR
jgi:PKD repeat protein